MAAVVGVTLKTVGAGVTVTAKVPVLLHEVLVFVTTTDTEPDDVPVVAVIVLDVPPLVIVHPLGTVQL